MIFPASPTFIITRARLPLALVAGEHPLTGPDADGLVTCDLAIDRGRIAALAPSGTLTGTSVDARHGIVLPRFVDVHTHLDKGHIIARAPNPDGSFMGARNTVMEDREALWSTDDVQKRMDFALRCAFAHGTGAIRTHLDSLGKQAGISWPLFNEMRETWKGRITLQAAALYPIDMALDDAPQFRSLVETVARYGGVLGGLTFLGSALGPRDVAALDLVMQAATAHGLDLDFHVDESHAPEARSLEMIAEAAIRHRFKGRIVAGHCCSLTLLPEAERDRVIGLVAEAGIAIVSLPMCNMYLQDRNARRTPQWRGVAPLHELDAAGVPVMIASDNTRDPFYAYGDLDMLEVFREGTRILHLDHSDRPWLRLLGPASADVMRLPEQGMIRIGGAADLVLLKARTLNEYLARPLAPRTVLVNGTAIDSTLPDYAELDGLTGVQTPF